jgi:hypothetical protein
MASGCQECRYQWESMVRIGDDFFTAKAIDLDGHVIQMREIGQ